MGMHVCVSGQAPRRPRDALLCRWPPATLQLCVAPRRVCVCAHTIIRNWCARGALLESRRAIGVQGVVTINWQNLCKVEMESSEEKVLLWNNKNLAKYFANCPPETAKTQISDTFEQRTTYNRANVESEWSR